MAGDSECMILCDDSNESLKCSLNCPHFLGGTLSLLVKWSFIDNLYFLCTHYISQSHDVLVKLLSKLNFLHFKIGKCLTEPGQYCPLLGGVKVWRAQD